MQEIVSLAVDSLTSWILHFIAFGINHEGSQTDIQTYCFIGFR